MLLMGLGLGLGSAEDGQRKLKSLCVQQAVILVEAWTSGLSSKPGLCIQDRLVRAAVRRGPCLSASTYPYEGTVLKRLYISV